MKRIWVIAGLMALGACSQPPSPSVSYGVGAGAGSAGIHTILPGDTVYSISKHYHLPTRDIVVLNQLSAPYKLVVGYRLRLPPPNEYTVKKDDTLHIIANLFDVPQSDIVRLNNLASPYRLRIGQVLRLPSPKDKTVASAPAAATTLGRAPLPDKVDREVLSAPAPQTSPSSSGHATVQKTSAAPPKLPDTVPPRTGGGKFMWPVQGNVVSSYGPKADGLHNDGINIKAPRGTPVRAAENGTVVYASNELKGYGNLVIVRHADQYMTAYAHMDKMLVKRGENVKAGQSIGTVGATGGVDSPQLHFEIRKGTKPLDPQKYL
jgi:murein DD-endopeptidase MepM/ murein hydrolase activator NlpD